MKKLLIMIVIMIFTALTYAEETWSTENSLYMGATALDIYAPLDGTARIGGRYFLSDGAALELALSFRFQNEESDVAQAGGGMFSLQAAYDYYLTDTRVSPYLKGGLEFGYAGGDEYENSNDDGFLFGILGGFGAEFFIIKQFSVSGEALVIMQFSPSVIIATVTPRVKASFFFDLF